MPKNLKLNLNELKVQSFVTALTDEEKNMYKGGGSGDDCVTGTTCSCAGTCNTCAATCGTCAGTCGTCGTFCQTCSPSYCSGGAGCC